MLRVNRGLLELDISNNDLVANTLVAISEVLKHNKTLLAFSCAGNKGTPRMETSFVDLFAKKENITLLQISLPMDPESENKGKIDKCIQTNIETAKQKLQKAQDRGDNLPFSQDVVDRCPVM